MVKGMLRVIFGFAVACLAAGLAMVLFVYTPLELATEHATDRMLEAGLLALAAATHSAVFAAPFALIGAAFGEWQRIASWLYYALVGVAIACVGFLAQFWTEADGEASIVNSYAMTAFIVTGFVAGVVYWLLAGRLRPGTTEGGPRPSRSSRRRGRSSRRVRRPRGSRLGARPGEPRARRAHAVLIARLRPDRLPSHCCAASEFLLHCTKRAILPLRRRRADAPGPSVQESAHA